MVRNETFTQIGEKYGVSYTSIKKWCKSMNIPHRKQDIEKYSDDEWENV